MDAAAIDLDFRAQRGLAIVKAKGTSIRQIVADKYLVPSQTLASGGYVVDVTSASCTCPDWAERGGIGHEHRCKHLWAVLYVRHEVAMPDGNTVVTTKKITIKRDWHGRGDVSALRTSAGDCREGLRKCMKLFVNQVCRARH